MVPEICQFEVGHYNLPVHSPYEKPFLNPSLRKIIEGTDLAFIFCKL